MNQQVLSSNEREEDRQFVLQKLEKVSGIGPKTAPVFYEMGIRSLSDLVKYLEQTSTDEISKDYQEHGVKRNPGLIDKKNMITSAKELGGNESEFARFTVTFHWVRQKDGSRRLLTTVYYPGHYGKDEPFYGEDPKPWVDWILNHANLPTKMEAHIDLEKATTLPEPTQPEVEESLQAHSGPVDLEILSVDVFNFSTGQTTQKTLTAEIQFKIPSIQLNKGIKGEAYCQADVYLHDLESDSIQHVSTGQIGLVPEQSRYQLRLDFPFPNLGHYEIQTNLCLLVPEASVAFDEGPRFKVTPSF